MNITGSNSFTATVENNTSGTCKKGLIFVYQDEYCIKLLGVCKIEIQAITYIKFSLRAGEEYLYEILVQNLKMAEKTSQRTIELFSQNPSMIYPAKGEDRCVHTVPADRDSGYKVPICIRSLTTGKAKTRLTCLDINSREII